MKDLFIRLHSFEDARALADLAMAQPYRILVSDEHHTVNVKSLMCLFSLDLNHTLRLQLECSEWEFEAFRHAVSRFEV